MTLTPGAYLKLRRTAAGFCLGDVAQRLAAEPHIDERARAGWLELVEADEQPVNLTSIVALRRVFPFDLEVLISLERIAQGSAEMPHAICRVCGCTEYDACCTDYGDGCWWSEEDLCSACAEAAEEAAAA